MLAGFQGAVYGGPPFLPPRPTGLSRPALPGEGRGNGLTPKAWGTRPAAPACGAGKPRIGPSRDFSPACCPGIDATWTIAQFCSGRGWGEVLLVCPCPSPPLEQRSLQGQEHSKPKQAACHLYCRYRKWHLIILGLLRVAYV